jgi:hypothetical protein
VSECLQRDVVGARVQVGGELVGHVTGVVFHPASGPIGLEDTGIEHDRRFLPLVGVTCGRDAVELSTALVLLDAWETYAANGAVVTRSRAVWEGRPAGIGSG